MSIEINDLPEEVLEFILRCLPPYKDLEECKLVCKRWNSIVKNVIRRSKLSLHKGLCDFNLCWKINANQYTSSSTITLSTSSSWNGNGMAGRFSHSAVIHENSMYIFGGGSSTGTTFNDLWRFDLSKRQWIRPVSTGQYPSPKGSATMLCYKNQLILFGGWRYPSLHPPYQPWCLFDELHLYDIKENRWILQQTTSCSSCNSNNNANNYNDDYDDNDRPPPMAGHSATIHANQMIVFGGYQINNEVNSNSNDLWCLNLDTFQWWKPQIQNHHHHNNKPSPRYGQYQIALDDQHLLIIGGCGGPNNVFSDAWLLNMSARRNNNNNRSTDNAGTGLWEWKNLKIKNKKFAASHMWCNPACQVGNKLIVLGSTSNLPSNNFQIVRQHHLRALRVGGGAEAGELHRNRAQQLQQQQQQQRPIIAAGSNFRLMQRINRNNNNANNDNNINNNSNNRKQVREIAAAVPVVNGDNVPVVAENVQQQNHAIEDEAANRLKRNLALRSRGDDVELPKRFDEPFEYQIRMAAFNVNNKKLEKQRIRPEYLRRHPLPSNNNAAASVSVENNLNVAAASSVVVAPPLPGGVSGGLAVDQVLAPVVAIGGGSATARSPPSSSSSSTNSLNSHSNNSTSSPAAVSNEKQQQQQEEPSPKRTKRNLLAMYVCDMSNVLSSISKSKSSNNTADGGGSDANTAATSAATVSSSANDNSKDEEPYLEWIEHRNYGILNGAPERLILSTIVAGNGELIMFGGVHKESLCEMTHQVSNSVHFLTPPKEII